MTDPSQSLTPLSTPSLIPAPAQPAVEYWIDGWQRTILFWDVLRQRSDQMDVPSLDRAIIVTEAAINIFPTLEDKIHITQNAIDLARVLGLDQPKVAILSAMETVNPKVPSTHDPAGLLRGGHPGCPGATRGRGEEGARLMSDAILVFTAGIGEHAASIREQVCRHTAWLGVELDPTTNAAGGPRISTADSRTSAWVVPTNEELMIARQTRHLLNPVSQGAQPHDF